MKSENKKDHSVGEDVYVLHGNYGVKLIILSAVVLFLGFACQVSLTPRIEQMVASGLNQNKGCPIYADQISFSWITLSLKLKNIRISGTCWRSPQSNLALDEIRVGLGFPGIWPLGLKLNVNVKGEDSLIRTSFLLGMKKVLYIRKNSRLSSKALNALMGQGNILTGNIFMTGSVELGKNRVEAAQLALQSKHLGFLPKTIRVGSLPFTLPTLNVAPVMVGARLKRKKIEITSLRLGNPKGSALFVDLKGPLALNKRQNRIQDIDIQGDLKVSNELLEGPLSILNLMWNIKKKPNKDGLYKIKLSGPFPSALTKPEFLP